MAKRNVYRTGKDGDGDITKLCNGSEPWSPREKDEAISDIENKTHEYYSNGETSIHVVEESDGSKYLRTDPNGEKGDNLDNLPDC